ncbi:MAG: outer membrane beta-barrel protein [Ferruginibacter sp.]|nr:outer membrane beta-barrel protein [Ferruginibacter sp.]
MPHIFRKQTAILGLFLGLALMTVAQDATPVSTVDNSIRPFSGGSQFRKFSVGVNVGVLSPSVVIGGSNDFSNPQFGLGYGANLRYQFNHWFAVQADFLRGSLKGNQDEPYGTGQPVTERTVTSFKTDLKYAGSLSGQLTLGNINWLREKNRIVPYLSAGLGIAGYSPKIVRRGSTTEVDYADETIKELFVPVGVGAKINLSSLINLDLGYRMQFVDGDNFDGSAYWAANPDVAVSTTKKDKFSYGFVGLEFALGNQSKPQLLFDNPAARMNSSIQTQIDTIKQDILGIKTDTDGDGVADMFDKEPNTPAGSPVDSHGVTRDTDNDGVPDWKDKQMITPSECQPVDADGVGKCPEPACCTTLDSLMRSGTFGNNCPTDYPSLSLKGTSLSADVKAMLSSVASKLKDSPNCTITITAYPGASKAQQSLADRKLTAVKNYLVETLGVSEDRITTDKMIGGGDANVIDIK